MHNIEELNLSNVEDYAKVNALSWKESYKGIVNDEFLELVNTEDEINKNINRLKESLLDKDKKRFILKVDNEYVGVLCVRKSKYDKYQDYGEIGDLYLLNKVKHKGYGKILFNKAKQELIDMGYSNMINGCLKDNPSNEFYKHMGGILIDKDIFKIPNQDIIENIYIYKNIKE